VWKLSLTYKPDSLILLITKRKLLSAQQQHSTAHFPDDDERPIMPHYIPSWEGHRSELAKKYPLQLVSPHPRFSFHTHYDKHAAWLDEIPGHRIIKDGYAWWPARIHLWDAELRGIEK